MLKEILDIIYNSRMFSVASISEKLDISEDMVNDLVSQLINRGYLLEETPIGCDTNKCSSCPMACSNHTPIKTLILTDKGLDMVR